MVHKRRRTKLPAQQPLPATHQPEQRAEWIAAHYMAGSLPQPTELRPWLRGTLPTPAGSSLAEPTGGQPLPHTEQATFKSQLGFDFANVRLHSDAEATHVTEQLDAQAVTVGQHIYFAPTTLNLSTPEGEALLVHELVHTVQQRNRPVRPMRKERSTKGAKQLETAALDAELARLRTDRDGQARQVRPAQAIDQNAIRLPEPPEWFWALVNSYILVPLLGLIDIKLRGFDYTGVYIRFKEATVRQLEVEQFRVHHLTGFASGSGRSLQFEVNTVALENLSIDLYFAESRLQADPAGVWNPWSLAALGFDLGQGKLKRVKVSSGEASVIGLQVTRWAYGGNAETISSKNGSSKTLPTDGGAERPAFPVSIATTVQVKGTVSYTDHVLGIKVGSHAQLAGFNRANLTLTLKPNKRQLRLDNVRLANHWSLSNVGPRERKAKITSGRSLQLVGRAHSRPKQWHLIIGAGSTLSLSLDMPPNGTTTVQVTDWDASFFFIAPPGTDFKVAEPPDLGPLFGGPTTLARLRRAPWRDDATILYDVEKRQLELRGLMLGNDWTLKIGAANPAGEAAWVVTLYEKSLVSALLRLPEDSPLEILAGAIDASFHVSSSKLADMIGAAAPVAFSGRATVQLRPGPISVESWSGGLALSAHRALELHQLQLKTPVHIRRQQGAQSFKIEAATLSGRVDQVADGPFVFHNATLSLNQFTFHDSKNRVSLTHVATSKLAGQVTLTPEGDINQLDFYLSALTAKYVEFRRPADGVTVTLTDAQVTGGRIQIPIGSENQAPIALRNLRVSTGRFAVIYDSKKSGLDLILTGKKLRTAVNLEIRGDAAVLTGLNLHHATIDKLSVAKQLADGGEFAFELLGGLTASGHINSTPNGGLALSNLAIEVDAFEAMLKTAAIDLKTVGKRADLSGLLLIGPDGSFAIPVLLFSDGQLEVLKLFVNKGEITLTAKQVSIPSGTIVLPEHGPLMVTLNGLSIERLDVLIENFPQRLRQSAEDADSEPKSDNQLMPLLERLSGKVHISGMFEWPRLSDWLPEALLPDKNVSEVLELTQLLKQGRSLVAHGDRIMADWDQLQESFNAVPDRIKTELGMLQHARDETLGQLRTELSQFYAKAAVENQRLAQSTATESARLNESLDRLEQAIARLQQELGKDRRHLLGKAESQVSVAARFTQLQLDLAAAQRHLRLAAADWVNAVMAAADELLVDDTVALGALATKIQQSFVDAVDRVQHIGATIESLTTELRGAANDLMELLNGRRAFIALFVLSELPHLANLVAPSNEFAAAVYNKLLQLMQEAKVDLKVRADLALKPVNFSLGEMGTIHMQGRGTNEQIDLGAYMRIKSGQGVVEFSLYAKDAEVTAAPLTFSLEDGKQDGDQLQLSLHKLEVEHLFARVNRWWPEQPIIPLEIEGWAKPKAEKIEVVYTAGTKQA